jgi:hypothetical protein
MAAAKLDQRDVRIDPLLSSISIAFKNAAYIASEVAPVIPSAFDGGKFTQYNQADWFRDEAGKRGAGARAKRGDFGITFATYFCEEVAFAREIPDEIRRNAMDPIRPDQDASNYATDKVLLSKEVRVAAKFNTAANWATGHSVTLAGATQWSDYSASDPIGDIEAGVDKIKSKTGKKPNVMIVPASVWKSLKHHPDIVDRIKYSQRGIVTVELLAELVEIERILKAEAIVTASNEGVAAGAETYSYVWGKDVWLGYITPNPGIQEPTAMYQFAVNGVTGRAVRRWREEPEHQDVIEAYELVDEHIVSTLLGYVIKAAVL